MFDSSMLLAAGQEPSPKMLIGWFLIMILIMYFILIRPQQRKEKERKALLQSVKSGDRVLFSGGILGSVTNVKDKVLTIRIAEKTKIEGKLRDLSLAQVAEFEGRDDGRLKKISELTGMPTDQA